jgi:hypothetical protein
VSGDMRERLAEALGHMRIRALVPEHGCGGDESECYRLCPIPVEVDETTVLDALLPLIAEAEANARAEGRREGAAKHCQTCTCADLSGVPIRDGGDS